VPTGILTETVVTHSAHGLALPGGILDIGPMGKAVSFFKKLLGLLVVLGLVFTVVQFYSVIFAKTVVGRIENVARVTEVTAILGNRQVPESQIYSFSVSVRQPSGEMLTATSEDRQWAVAKTGQCVKAKYFPYPPWDFEKVGTYFNARLISLVECGSPAAKDLGIDTSAYPPQAVGAQPAAPMATPAPLAPPSSTQEHSNHQ